MKIFRHCRLFAILLMAASLATAQTRPTHPPPASPGKSHCQPEGGFCFRYPSSWTILGQVFDGNGVVIAPSSSQQQSMSDEITVAMVMAPPEGDEETPTIDTMIEQTSKTIRESGQDFQTLQRQHRTVDHLPAEMLKVRYREKDSGKDWMEEILFIDGPDNEIYSVALKCSPQNLARMEKVLAGVLNTWKLPEAP